ncbi:MAG: pilin, partial [Patescibacteria group bacterium]
MRNKLNRMLAKLSVLPMLALPAMASAQTDPPKTGISGAQANLEALSTKVGDAPKDLPLLIGGIINAVLGILGIVFVIFVLYAGYLWMTASGEKEKVDKSKQLLGQAVIGLVIIVAAYAISTFV